MNSHLESHKLTYHQISTSAGIDVLDKMESKTFTQIGAALFFRAILTCIARIHLEHLNTNGYPNKLLNHGRKPSGHQIMKHFYKDILSGNVRKSHTRQLRKWLKSFDKHEMFRQLYQRVQFWGEVVHVEDPNTPVYKIQELDDDCELLLDYSRALITHPPWPLLEKHQ